MFEPVCWANGLKYARPQQNCEMLMTDPVNGMTNVTVHRITGRNLIHDSVARVTCEPTINTYAPMLASATKRMVVEATI